MTDREKRARHDELGWVMTMMMTTKTTTANGRDIITSVGVFFGWRMRGAIIMMGHITKLAKKNKG
jgi:hypothetical protein